MSLQGGMTSVAAVAALTIVVISVMGEIGLPAGSDEILLKEYNPDSFSCEGRGIGYYANVDSDCQVQYSRY